MTKSSWWDSARLILCLTLLATLLAIMVPRSLIAQTPDTSFAQYGNYTDDGILKVTFERTWETPVSITFRVTILNRNSTKNYPISFSLAEDSTMAVNSLNAIKIEKVIRQAVTYYDPVYENQLLSYKSAFGIYENLTYTDPTIPEMSYDYFRDYSKDGMTILKEHYYRMFDYAGTWYWYEDVLTGNVSRIEIEESKTTTSTIEPKKGQTATNITINDSLTKEGEYERGVTVYDVTINTGLFKYPTSGYGSKGMLRLNINGHAFYDGTNSSWWNTDWLKRTKLTFDNSASSTNLTNFPVMVRLSEPTIEYDDFQADGGDIRFIDADGSTDLDYEIDTWNSAGNSTIWVEIPSLASTATDYVIMYYDNSTVGNGWDINGTWDSNFVAVYHMNDGANTSVLSGSTTLNSAGNKKGPAEPAQGDYAPGKGQDFDGTNDLVTVADSASLSGLSTLTMESYFNQDIQNYEGLISKYTSANPNIEWTFNILAGALVFNLYSADYNNNLSAIGTTDLSDGSYHYGAATFDGINAIGHIILYADGVADILTTDAKGGTGYVPHNGSQDVELGRFLIDTYCFDGKISETRISNIVRSADWIKATYLTMTSGTFVTFGNAGTLDVDTDAATNIATTSATLNGEIVDAENQLATARGFEWDTDSGAPYANSWTENGNYAEGTFSHAIAVGPGDYYFRAFATDSDGTAYGAELNFSISGGGAATHEDSLHMKISSANWLQTEIEWLAVADATEYMLRVKTHQYPLTTVSGTLVYQGDALSALDFKGINKRYTLFWLDSGGEWHISYRGHLHDTYGRTD